MLITLYYLWHYQNSFKRINIKNRAYNYYHKRLTKVKNIETRNILIKEKNYKNLITFFTRYDHGKLIGMLRLYYHELFRKIEDHAEKNT